MKYIANKSPLLRLPTATLFVLAFTVLTYLFAVSLLGDAVRSITPWLVVPFVCVLLISLSRPLIAHHLLYLGVSLIAVGMVSSIATSYVLQYTVLFISIDILALALYLRYVGIPYDSGSTSPANSGRFAPQYTVIALSLIILIGTVNIASNMQHAAPFATLIAILGYYAVSSSVVSRLLLQSRHMRGLATAIIRIPLLAPAKKAIINTQPAFLLLAAALLIVVAPIWPVHQQAYATAHAVIPIYDITNSTHNVTAVAAQVTAGGYYYAAMCGSAPNGTMSLTWQSNTSANYYLFGSIDNISSATAGAAGPFDYAYFNSTFPVYGHILGANSKAGSSAVKLGGVQCIYIVVLSRQSGTAKISGKYYYSVNKTRATLLIPTSASSGMVDGWGWAAPGISYAVSEYLSGR